MQEKKIHVHFVGIGGIGMSAIASVMKCRGYKISGCDNNTKQKSIDQLRKIDCEIYEGNNSDKCGNRSIDLCVYSSAIKPYNPEIIAAKKNGIEVIPRAEMLSRIMSGKKNILVSGSHGKTTTSSLISHILVKAKLDPTIVVGGFMHNLDANYRNGKSNLFVAEADESDRSFLMLSPSIAIVTNIDFEHLDNYKDLNDIKQTFIRFLSKLPENGKAVLCIDDKNTASIIPKLPQELHKKIITYGLDTKSNFYISKCELNTDHSICTVHTNRKNKPENFYLPMPGKHNALNMLAAIAVCSELNVAIDKTKNALKTFRGIDQRFSFKGLYKGAELFDDYGHHPTEIEKILTVAKKRSKKKLIVLFQPHRYTRTKKLWKNFIEVFSSAEVDHLVITDIYPASEDPIEDIDSQRFVCELKNKTFEHSVFYATANSNFREVHKILDQILEPNDLVLFLGAGKINSLIEKFKT